MGERPSGQTPRFCISLTRSKRFRTLRFAPTLLDFLRLECCDMTGEAGGVRWSADFRAGWGALQARKIKENPGEAERGMELRG